MASQIENKAVKIEMVKVSELAENPKNPNRHSDEQIDRLCEIIKYQGFRDPLIVSTRSGYIVSGHGRLMAAKKLGIEEIPCTFQDFEDDDQEYAAIVSENSIASWAELDLSSINAQIPEFDPSFNIDLLGIKDFVIEPAEKFQGDEDDVPEPQKPIVKIGELYILGEHRLLCGDSTDAAQVERLMNDEKADMVFTDPPYGVSIVETSSALKKSGYRPILNDGSINTGLSAINILKKYSENLVIWGGNYFAHELPESGCWIVWLKKENESDQHDFEVAWLSIKGKMAVFSHKWSGWWRDSEKGEQRSHPTQKPVALATWCFENYGEPKIVLDVFLGSGSTLIACEKTNRKCRGAEIDPLYCDVIIQRWMKYTGKMAYLIGDANGELKSGPVSYAELISLRSKTHSEGSKNTAQRNAGLNAENTEEQLA